MGRTVPTFRMALDGEFASYRKYRAALQSQESRDALEDLFNQARTNCMAAGNASRPTVFQGFTMAVLFSHERRMEKLGKGIEELRLSLQSSTE